MGTPASTVVATAPAAPTAEFRSGWPSKSTPSKPAFWFVMGLATVLAVFDLILLAHFATGNTLVSGMALLVTQIFYRWIHFIAGIFWIGLLYFFNFVNVPFSKESEFGAVKGVYIPKLLGRAIFWFRWTAMLTVIAGWGLLLGSYTSADLFNFGVSNAHPLLGQARGPTILFGMLLGMAMWANVWFVIWPNQKKLIYAVESKQSPDPNWGKKALLASRANAVMSFPMLFFMGAASHFPLSLAGIGLFIALGAAFSWLVIQISAQS